MLQKFSPGNHCVARISNAFQMFPGVDVAKYFIEALVDENVGDTGCYDLLISGEMNG